MTALKRIERARIVAEGNGSSTFGIDASANIANFKDLRYNSMEVTLGQEMLSDDHVVQRAYTEPKHVLGPKFCEVTFTVDLAGRTSPLNAGAGSPAYTDSALSILLRTIFGGYRVGIGTTENSGSSSTTSLLHVTDAAGFAAGGAVAYVASGNRFDAREIDAISGTQITPKLKFSAAAGDTVGIFNAETYYPLTDDHSTIDSLQMVVETTERDNIYWLFGLQCTSFSLECTLGQLAKVTVTLRGVNWVQDDSAGTPLGGSAMSAATYTDGDPIPHVTSRCHFVTGSEPYDIAEVDPSSLSYTISLKHDPLPSPGGINGVRRWVRIPQRPTAEVEFTIPVNSGDIKTLQAARDARTAYSWFHTLGSVISSTTADTGMWLISLPTVQIMDVQRTESAGMHGAKIRCKALEDADTAGGTDLLYAPVRLHRF